MTLVTPLAATGHAGALDRTGCKLHLATIGIRMLQNGLIRIMNLLRNL